MLIQGFKWFVRALMAGIIALAMVNCTQLGLNYSSLETDGKPAAYPALEGELLARLSNDRNLVLSVLETHIFGPVPEGIAVHMVDRRIVDAAYANGAGTLEEITFTFGPEDNQRRFNLAVAFPNNTSGPAPLIINQTFCPNRITFGTNQLSPVLSKIANCGDDAEASGIAVSLMTGIFGRHIGTPPTQRVLERGYAMASFYASEIVPDAGPSGRVTLASFPEGARGRPSGAVAAWTLGYVAALNVLEADARIDAGRTAVIGHSRHAKSALVAGTFEHRIEAVIAHQAGTGGTALSRQKPGENVAYITRNYPHWFAPSYAEFDKDGPNTTPTDLHMLIALNAPKKVLLGNGRRDVWSDPNGSYRATLSANAAWKAIGAGGMAQSGMRDLNLAADLIFYMRSGGHGIIKQDWDTFLDFLDAAMPATISGE